jgi:formate hydrogenlyase subunit 6/NADH:ubiquinone oxidoreductase subunit I
MPEGAAGVSGVRAQPTTEHAVLAADQLRQLISALLQRGYTVIAPTVRDGAIVLEAIESSQDLPLGWTDEQEPGRYRIKLRDDQALFGYAASPHSWKRFLHPPEMQLWAAVRDNGSFRILNHEEPHQPLALLGVRACDLAAIAAQDRVLLEDKYRDPIYASRRESAFVVAVQCTQAAATCFCASMGSGPKVEAGFDLALTELADDRGHRFVVEVGSKRGAEVLSELEVTDAPPHDLRRAESAAATAAAQQVRKIERDGLRELLYGNFDHGRWEEIASRCLACGNCTMVCPTCFCITVEDTTDVSGQHAERWRRWDSCFTQNFSYIHGGSIRASAKARYRQWMTHKLAAWIDQFGTSGCVGCGRCVTWCPVGIDITQEARALREAVHGNT